MLSTPHSRASDHDTKAQHDTKPTHATDADMTRLILSQRCSQQRFLSMDYGSSIPRNLTAMSATRRSARLQDEKECPASGRDSSFYPADWVPPTRPWR